MANNTPIVIGAVAALGLAAFLLLRQNQQNQAAVAGTIAAPSSGSSLSDLLSDPLGFLENGGVSQLLSGVSSAASQIGGAFSSLGQSNNPGLLSSSTSTDESLNDPGLDDEEDGDNDAGLNTSISDLGDEEDANLYGVSGGF